MEYYNKLTPSECELIALLAEECSEVIQVCGKILRHGIDSCHPISGTNNRSSLEKEIADVEVIISLLSQSGMVDDEKVSSNRFDKNMSLPKYLHHNKSLFGIEEDYEGF